MFKAISLSLLLLSCTLAVPDEAPDMVVTVAPSGYTGQADYYCTGSQDEILINAAIKYVNSAYSGGTVQLLEGTFTITGTISLLANTRLVGAGDGTVLDASGSTAIGIQSVGTASALVNGPEIRSFKILGNVSNTDPNIYFNYTAKSKIENIQIFGTNSDYALHCVNSNTVLINNNIIDGNLVSATSPASISLTSCTISSISKNTVQQIRTAEAYIAIEFSGSSSGMVSENHVYDISSSANFNCYGIYCEGNCSQILGNRVEQVKNSLVATMVRGIGAGGTNVKVDSNYCYNNGSDTGIANTNGNNFSDAGTDTQTYSNSWQSPVAGEPSLGTMHPHYYVIAANTSLGAAGSPYTVDLSAEVPVGTKAAWFWLWGIIAVAGTIQVQNTAGTKVYDKKSGLATQAVGVSCPVELDSNRTFKFLTNQNLSQVDDAIAFYWD